MSPNPSIAKLSADKPLIKRSWGNITTKINKLEKELKIFQKTYKINFHLIAN